MRKAWTDDERGAVTRISPGAFVAIARRLQFALDAPPFQNPGPEPFARAAPFASAEWCPHPPGH